VESASTSRIHLTTMISTTAIVDSKSYSQTIVVHANVMMGITTVFQTMIGFAEMQKGEPMAEIKVPINVNLPDDWVEQIVNRLRNDPYSEWVEVTRCKDCKYYDGRPCGIVDWYNTADDFCSRAERRTNDEG